ncbi:MAG: hypothetical protein LBT50_04795 [Prevotellaceae bacterium]|jgi:hypothetical protein|nr:hypothetical protein [Prevotellaceae bacterium]
MKKINILLMSLLILMAGCDSVEYLDFEDIQVPIESAETQFSAAGGQKHITVGVSNYTVTSDQTWCTLTTNGKTINVSVLPNKTVSGRTALVTIKSEGKVSYVPVTQTGVTLTLDTYAWDASPKGDSIHIIYDCDFPLSTATFPNWIIVSINEETKSITLTANQNTSFTDSKTTSIQLYVDDGNDAKMAPKEIIVTQGKNFLNYGDYLGDYTMRYTTTAGTNSTPTKSLDVSLVTAVEGSTYYLKGILIDESAGNIVVNYEPATGNITILGRIIGKTTPDNWDFWWLPYSYANATPTSFYISRTITYGMRSADIDISGNLKFGMKDIGNWSGYTVFGFILRNYDGSTSKGNINGNGSDYRYYYPTFEKK